MRLLLLAVTAIHGLISVAAVAAPQGPSGPPISNAVDAFIQAKMKERPIPGLAVAVIRDGRLEKLSAFGIANLEFGVAVTTDTLFSVASVSKAFAGLAVMRLVEDGSISLDDPVGKHLTQLPLAWRPVTVRQLLNHTSGLPVIDVDAFSTRTRAQTIPDALRLLGNEPLVSPVGAQWNYNGTNYMVVGMLVEALSGTSFAEFCRLRLFEPFGIRTASFGDSRALVANRATVYTRFRFDTAQPQRIERSEVLDFSMPILAYPAAGLNISIRDFATWMLALHQERLVTRRALEALWEPARLSNGTAYVGNPPASTSYGLGWTLNQSPIHPAVGGTGGLRAAFAVYPKDSLSVAVLTNFQGAGPEAIVEGIAKIYLANEAGGVRR